MCHVFMGGHVTRTRATGIAGHTRPTTQRSNHTTAVASTSHMDPRLGKARLPGGIHHGYMPTLQEGASHPETPPLGLCATAG